MPKLKMACFNVCLKKAIYFNQIKNKNGNLSSVSKSSILESKSTLIAKSQEQIN